MAFGDVQVKNFAISAGAGAPAAVTLDNAVAIGDILLVPAAMYPQTANPPTCPRASGGFTLVTGASTNTGSNYVQWWLAVCDSPGSAQITFDTIDESEYVTAQAIGVTGPFDASPVEDVGVAGPSSFNNGQTHTTDTVTVAGSAVLFAAITDDQSAGTLSNASDSWTQRYNDGGGGAYNALGVRSRLVSAGTYSTSWTNTSGSGQQAISGILALKAAASGGGFTGNVGLGQLTLVGLAPQVPKVSTIGLGQLTLTGLAPAFLSGGGAVTVTIGLGQLTLNGLAPTVILGLKYQMLHSVSNLAQNFAIETVLEVGLGQLLLTGLASAFQTPATFRPDLGQLILTGFPPSIDADLVLPIPLGQLLLTGYPLSSVGTPGAGGGSSSIIHHGRHRRGALLRRR